MFQFDGVNLLITWSLGTTAFTAENLYSEWKQWVLINDNAKFSPAFRTSGGDNLTPGISAGAYYFIRNDLGWRIRPAEENANVTVTGNLAPENSTLKILIPTLGDYTVLVSGLQPITQSVAELLELQQESLYQGVIHLDSTSNSSGTSFPVGTASEPVNNMSDALDLANKLGVKRIRFSGVFNLDRAVPLFYFEGVSGVALLGLNSQDVSGCRFEKMSIWGDMLDTMTFQTVVEDCYLGSVLGSLNNFWGTGNDCLISRDMTFQSGRVSTLANCASGIAGLGRPVFDMAGKTNLNIGFRNWTGGIQVDNSTDPANNFSIDIVSGTVAIDDTNTAGTFVARGVGKDEITNTLTNVSDELIIRYLPVDISTAVWNEEVCP